MSDLTALSKESVKSLGAGAYLVNALPGAVLVLSLAALVEARILPWSQPLIRDGRPVAPGLPSVVEAVRVNGVAGGVVLLLGIIVVAVLLRPFQIRIVQLLEGYWRRGGLLKAMAVERHVRQARMIEARKDLRFPQRPACADFRQVADHARDMHRASRIKDRAKEDSRLYPRKAEWILATRLGNILRRAETTAGERYGLKTVEVYPRLYPHLSPRLDAQINEQLNAIDVMATFVLVFGVETVACAALLQRLDWWSTIPLVFAGLAGLSYRGATTAAAHYGGLLITAFDLHRFDMLKAMRLPLPENGQDEYESNERLVDLLLEPSREISPEERERFVYEHPEKSEEPSAEAEEKDQSG